MACRSPPRSHRRRQALPRTAGRQPARVLVRPAPLGSPAKMDLEQLTDVHTGRNAQGVQHISSGVPSGRKGMSSTGRTREITPLLPWRPAILSPAGSYASERRRRERVRSRRGQLVVFARLKRTFTSHDAAVAVGHRREVSRTSRAFSPKMARSRRSSAVSSVSPFGVTLPTRISPEYLRADADDAAASRSAAHVVADVRDIAGDFLGAQLGVARIDLVSRRCGWR